MLSHPSFRPALAVGVVVAATTWFATRAGDLNPPKGPIEPTMVSLEDLYNRIGTQGDCPACAWQHKYVTWSTFQAGGGFVAAGPGMLHGVFVTGAGGAMPYLYDNADNNGLTVDKAIVRVHTGSPALMAPLDVRFTRGIYVQGFSETDGAGITVIYRLDP